MSYDYTVYLETNMIGIHPENETAIQFLDENVEAESWQYLGNVLWVELRNAGPLIKFLKDNGFVVHVFV